jgi:starch synthase
MKILTVASEATPFAKTGGLGDVIGSLPMALARLGHEVSVCIPRYRGMEFKSAVPTRVELTGTIAINGQDHPIAASSIAHRKKPLTHYFIENQYYFDRPELYRNPATGVDYDDNDERFIFFNRAVLELTKQLDWKPDIIHVHDWQAGLIPAYLKTVLSMDRFFEGTRTVLTIHNLAYQGLFAKENFAHLGLPPELFFATAPFEFYDKVNFLKAAISYADKITTVSPRYSREIQTEEMGAGLDGVLKGRSADLHGIINGVDYTVWSPSRDKNISHTYYAANLSGKRIDKVDLVRESGLPVRERTPLIGIISRLADQKGFDLIAEAADLIFAMDLQMVVLGTGEKKYHELFKKLEEQYPDKIKVYLTFNDKLAHQIEAGSDIFLMPSHYEPCGLNQMYSLKYATLPVVREVGGLADTVKDVSEDSLDGTGFVFKEYTSDAMLEALSRAVKLYRKTRVWTGLMKRAMKEDFSWDSSARQYISLFEQLVGSDRHSG